MISTEHHNDLFRAMKEKYEEHMTHWETRRAEVDDRYDRAYCKGHLLGVDAFWEDIKDIMHAFYPTNPLNECINDDTSDEENDI